MTDEQREIQVNHIGLVVCPACKGKGRFYGSDSGTPWSCAYCNGRGEVLEPSYAIKAKHSPLPGSSEPPNK